jgi:hypothetical protein
MTERSGRSSKLSDNSSGGDRPAADVDVMLILSESGDDDIKLMVFADRRFLLGLIVKSTQSVGSADLFFV